MSILVRRPKFSYESDPVRLGPMIRLREELMGVRMSPLTRARMAVPSLIYFCIGVLATSNVLLGVYLITAPATRFSGNGWVDVKQLMSINQWGILYTIAGSLIAFYVVTYRRFFAYCGLVLGCLVSTGLAAGVLFRSMEVSSGVSLVLPLTLLPLVVFHIAFATALDGR